jgi:MFS transporter, ACS family, hexuronate transporter
MALNASQRSGNWKWWVCGLLLFASAINYMDRQTLANAASRITRELSLRNEQYGDFEFGFGWAFAVGSLVFGIAVDKFSVRIIYPIGLLLWSLTGFATGLAQGYEGILVCRTLLGFFEGAHWPCAVKTTRLLLEAKDRSMGNSLLQSGTSIGAIITPLVMRAMLTEAPGSWRWPFLVIGATGLLWVVAWFALIKRDDLPSSGPDQKAATSIWKVLLTRRMLVIFAVIALINTGWQTIRAWLPKFLQEGRGYSEAEALYFNSVFYIATDIGVIGAGALTLWLHRRKFTVTKARIAVFGICAVLAASSLMVPILPKGPALLFVLLIVGAGALGVFPIYHAFTQDLSREHQGKVTGVASIAAWAFSPPAQKYFGRLVDRTKSFDEGLMIAGLLPLTALVILALFWREPEIEKS